MELRGVQLTISGRVQGVFFRKSTEARARALGVLGYVQNLPDGKVFVDAQGSKEAVGLLVDFCHKGPPLAEVETVDVTDYVVALPGFTTFSIRRR